MLNNSIQVNMESSGENIGETVINCTSIDNIPSTSTSKPLRSTCTTVSENHSYNLSHPASIEDQSESSTKRRLDSVLIEPSTSGSQFEVSATGSGILLLSINSSPVSNASSTNALDFNKTNKCPHNSGSSPSNSSVDYNNKRYMFFNGMINDLRNRFPKYGSDIKDAFNFQCLTSVIFMFFACFAPSITFGGLMGKYTNEKMGTTETLFAQCICGILWGLFAAQPLLIMSATGPVLIFEASLYAFCENLKLDFLTVRLYTGFWIAIISLCIVAVDGSRLLAFVTRFTEEIFATLISAIFIAESLHFVWDTFKDNPVEDYEYYLKVHTNCQMNNLTLSIDSLANDEALLAAAQHLEPMSPFPPPESPLELPFDFDNISISARNINDTMAAAERFADAIVEAKRQILGEPFRKLRLCGDAEPNTALLTTFILFGTFVLAFTFKKLRESFYFGRNIRRALGDFGVLISIVVVALIVHIFIPDPYLQRLDMPNHVGFTNQMRRGHGLIVSAYLRIDEWYAVLISLIAALLIFILLFVETEITELLMGRKDRGCVKGNGMNWDLVLVSLCALLCSIFGLPWMCAAAVQSLAHCSSLTVMKKKAPGESPEVDHVIEQRVTTIGVSILIGIIALGGSYLRLPLASLFGVFLYLGVMNLSGLQFVHRIVLFFIPEKYFPVTPYTEQMTIWRMHLYTWIQLSCLFIVYIVKFFKRTALAFPFVLALFIVFRQAVLPKIFTEKELRAVDGDCELEDGEWMEKDCYENSRIPV